MKLTPGGSVDRDRASFVGTNGAPGGELSLGKASLLIFGPSLLLLIAYLPLSYLLRDTVPSLLVFFLLALLIMFPIQLAIVLAASKQEYGRYSLESAFSRHEALPWWRIAIYGTVLWGFAGIMWATVAPLEERLFEPLSDRLFDVLPAYLNWADLDLLEEFPRGVLLLTAFLYLILNGFIGPIIEELFFRGYLSARLSRYGDWTPVIVTVLFSLYHWWLPFNMVFRVAAFLPSFYVAWRLKNIYIAIVTHVLSNLVTGAFFIAFILSII